MRWWKAALLAAGLGLALTGGGTAASGHTGAAARGSVFTGYAFDACNAPGNDALTAWLASPYRALGIYIGGVNRACSNARLSADWAAAAVSTGWSLIPLYVGLQ